MSDNNDNNAVAGAIGYPSRSEETPAPEPLPIQPRPPRNLQGLLRFAMEATKSEDAPGNSEFGPMDEERKNFLEEALKSMTANMAEVLSKSIKVLSNPERIQSIQLGEMLPDDIITAFNNLLEVVDDIDIANDFYKMGGFAIFPVCYGSENEQVRLLASSVLAEVCQNNPYCQARALECGLLNVLLNLVLTERRLALSKCLSAISCTAREYDPACRELIAQGGCKTLAQLLTTDEPMVRTKAAFLIRYLCHSYPEAKKQFIEMNVIRTIAEQIKAGRDNTSEHILSIMLILVENNNPVVLAQCREPSLDLKQTLEKHLEHSDLIYDMFREEKEACEEILKKVFDSYPPIEVIEEIADRPSAVSS
ncbi:hsp70-binding protein 1 [Manduca sexta]|uniref:Nucleotide exchange factor Fes1 domain-containing protein n=1 Tax=Manduca sexta TaxID=7130 RepID=A0A921YPI5_MANSE|nr:hsp70-binding protein 1 [Manduca sexta]KAG6443055.1 hypothetical protein O3G_MSEX002688 [Manduca sexta]KAG6443056.1 hypothetical protein O3G_MSEX002688 [Manduca sexta]KAG6443057.1 hypothetical protein O3G_MSEX002688 [Manduca sexta]KAG6443058.1 hypothetical protein O3G_MSEX002688 [Manduca sexta]